jgi:hypothetical protein
MARGRPFGVLLSLLLLVLAASPAARSGPPTEFGAGIFTVRQASPCPSGCQDPGEFKLTGLLRLGGKNYVGSMIIENPRAFGGSRNAALPVVGLALKGRNALGTKVIATCDLVAAPALRYRFVCAGALNGGGGVSFVIQMIGTSLGVEPVVLPGCACDLIAGVYLAT